MKNLAHVVPFYGNPKAGVKPVAGVNYFSNDLRVIDTQLELMQRAMYDGVIVLTYADVDPFMQDACEKMLFLCEKRQMLFALCFDPWSMKDKTLPVEKKNSRWADLLKWTDPYLKSPAYLPERYLIDFATGADIPTVMQQNPGYQILRVYHEVSWPKVSAGLDSKVNLIEQNANAIIPGVMHSFSDYDPANPANSIWGGPARRIDAQDGLFELDTIKSIMANKGVAQYVQRISYNDYRERHSVERKLICDALRTGSVDVSALL